MTTDKNGKEIVLQDYEAKEAVGVQIGHLGHKLWVCIDGVAVLRVKAPVIKVENMSTGEDEKPSIANDNIGYLFDLDADRKNDKENYVRYIYQSEKYTLCYWARHDYPSLEAFVVFINDQAAAHLYDLENTAVYHEFDRSHKEIDKDIIEKLTFITYDFEKESEITDEKIEAFVNILIEL